ncbi:MAG: hypothetical protein M3Y37_02185, partial [Chloroflexota bacterium]|nr:hypothetical protein [Chloroflexota bacterium]
GKNNNPASDLISIRQVGVEIARLAGNPVYLALDDRGARIDENLLLPDRAEPVWRFAIATKESLGRVNEAVASLSGIDQEDGATGAGQQQRGGQPGWSAARNQRIDLMVRLSGSVLHGMTLPRAG